MSKIIFQNHALCSLRNCNQRQIILTLFTDALRVVACFWCKWDEDMSVMTETPCFLYTNVCPFCMSSFFSSFVSMKGTDDCLSLWRESMSICFAITLQRTWRHLFCFSSDTSVLTRRDETVVTVLTTVFCQANHSWICCDARKWETRMSALL